MLFATPQFAIQSFVYAHKLGWKPKVFVNAVSSASNIMGLSTVGAGKKQTEGSLSIVFLKDPTDARWAKDPGMKLYRSIMKRYKGGRAQDVYAVYGMSAAHTFVEALKKAGKNPTRDEHHEGGPAPEHQERPVPPARRHGQDGRRRPFPARPGESSSATTTGTGSYSAGCSEFAS